MVKHFTVHSMGRVKSQNSYTVMYHTENEESVLSQVQLYILLPNKTRAFAVVKELYMAHTFFKAHRKNN